MARVFGRSSLLSFSGGREWGNGQNFGNVKMYDAKFNIKRHIWANEDDLLYHFAL